MKTSVASVAARSASEDRAIVIDGVGGLVIALADGAGGLGHGARAAEAWIDAVVAHPRRGEWIRLLEELDADPSRRGPGLTTAISVAVHGDLVGGVCVGDSAAWWITDDAIVDLCEHVPAKPLVGDGCMVYEIESRFDRGTLLVASDGLVKYAGRDRIADLARGEDLDAATRALIDLVRLPSGKLQDDTSVILCRR